jgi:hypothetical protein
MDLGGSSSASFQFNNIGDSVSGKIIALDEVQQTDLDTGLPAVWPDGKPKMMIRVVLSTDLRDGPDDSGERTLYLRGSKKPESRSSLSAVIQAAIKATGKSAIDVGGWLSLAYTGDGEKTRAAYSAPKQYAAQYKAPSVDLAGGSTDNGSPATAPESIGSMIGWLNGKPITPTMKASMDAAGVTLADLPGFQPA